MLERILSPKKLVGLALMASVGMGITCCGGGESCSTDGQMSSALEGNGYSIDRIDPKSEYGQATYALKEDGCNEGCYPIDEDYCCCPY